MKEKINSIELGSTLNLCIFSSSIGMSLYTTIKLAGIDSYISVLIGAIIGVIPLLIFFYIFNYKENKTIHEKNIYIFGKIFGNIINILLITIFFVIGITVLFNASNFVVSQYLAETPLILILSIFGLIVLYAVNKGVESISRVSSLFILIIFFFFFLGVFGLLKDVKFDNLKPILEFGIKKPMLGGFVNMLITTSPMYALLLFPKNNITDKEKAYKYCAIGYSIAAIIIFFITFFADSVLGKYLIEMYQYPGYISLKRISLFGFIDRIENFLSIQWILSSFVTLSIIICYIKNYFKKKENSLVLSIVLITGMILCSYYIFKNSTRFNYYLYKYYPYILFALLMIYVIIMIGIFYKKKLKIFKN